MKQNPPPGSITISSWWWAPCIFVYVCFLCLALETNYELRDRRKESKLNEQHAKFLWNFTFSQAGAIELRVPTHKFVFIIWISSRNIFICISPHTSLKKPKSTEIIWRSETKTSGRVCHCAHSEWYSLFFFFFSILFLLFLFVIRIIARIDSVLGVCVCLCKYFRKLRLYSQKSSNESIA